jgi:hypothetical protein
LGQRKHNSRRGNHQPTNLKPLGNLENRSNSTAVSLVVVVLGIEIARIEVQVVCVGAIVHSRRPIAAVAALIVEAAIVIIVVA